MSEDCQRGLQAAMPGRGGKSTDRDNMGRVKALNRAIAAQDTLEAATAGSAIDWTMLAAIGIRETGFVNKREVDGAGVGWGIFQITNKPQAVDLAWSLDWGVKNLTNNANIIAKKISGLPEDTLEWMLAASWNTGPGKQIWNYNNGFWPDHETAPIGHTGKFHNDYGRSILDLMDCFK